MLTYQPLTLDGKDWTPANIAAAYNAATDNTINSSGPTGSMVFTSQIIEHNGYYYGYCGGVCAGFSGILVRSTDGINWTSVMVPEALPEMAGVIECGFQFFDDCIYFCMRDISSGVYQCSYNFTTKEQLTRINKISNLTTSKPLAFIQDGKLYIVVNKATNDENTVARRNTALFYQIDPETCESTLVKQVFCGDGISYHAVVNYDGINYWSFHTDARRINPHTQGRSNVAFLPMPSLMEEKIDAEGAVLTLSVPSATVDRQLRVSVSNLDTPATMIVAFYTESGRLCGTHYTGAENGIINVDIPDGAVTASAYLLDSSYAPVREKVSISCVTE